MTLSRTEYLPNIRDLLSSVDKDLEFVENTANHCRIFENNE